MYSLRNWWKKNSGKWENVRKVWGEIFEENNIIELKKVVDDKKLWEYLFSDEYQDEDEIRNVINEFILN